VLEQIMADKQRPALQSTRCELTVLFADIRNFTHFAEQHQPEAVVDLLNQYLDLMVGILFQYQVAQQLSLITSASTKTTCGHPSSSCMALVQQPYSNPHYFLAAKAASSRAAASRCTSGLTWL
jgi:class 3 adenylate cyclase